METQSLPVVELLLAMVSLLLGLLLAGLAWQLKRIIERVDKLEVAHSDYRMTIGTSHRPWSEIRAEIDRSIGPLKEQLDRIERSVANRNHWTGRHEAVGGSG
jgi:hypothetical protein